MPISLEISCPANILRLFTSPVIVNIWPHPLTCVSRTWTEFCRLSRIQVPIIIQYRVRCPSRKSPWGFGCPCKYCTRYGAHQEKTFLGKPSSKQTVQGSSRTVQITFMCLNLFKCPPEQQNCKILRKCAGHLHDLGCFCYFSWACAFLRTFEVDCGQPQSLHHWILTMYVQLVQNTPYSVKKLHGVSGSRSFQKQCGVWEKFLASDWWHFL